MHFPLVLADWLETVDAINEKLAHPDFDATVWNPWFIIGSLVFVTVALLRGWKALLIVYLAGMVMWYVIARYASATGGGGNSVFMVGIAVLVVAGCLIYFLLIKD